MKSTTKDLVKKIVPLVVIMIVLICIWVLSVFPPFGRMVCEVNSAPGKMSATYTYVADFSMWKVHDFKVVEVVNATDEVDLAFYRQSIEEDLLKYKDLEHFDNKIVVENKTLTNTITIDFKHIDQKLLNEIDSSFTKKTTKIRYLKEIYEKNGAVCKYI